MKKRVVKIIGIVLCVIGLICVACLTVYARTSHWDAEEEVARAQAYTEVETSSPEEVEEQVFDTSPLLLWGGDPQQGVLRMIGGMYYGVDDEGYTLVVDEAGHVWSIYQDIDTEDFLLLWIADNNTPNYVEDDEVVKVWREAY